MRFFKFKLIFLLIGVLVAAVLVRLYFNKIAIKDEYQAKAISSFYVIPVTQKVLEGTLELPGSIEAIEQVSIYSHVSGYLKKIYVDEGDKVKKNQLIAEIDAPDVTQDYIKAKTDYKLKKSTLERYQKLLKENVISQQEFDVISAAAEVAKSKLDSATATMSYTKILAPFAGSVARRYKYPGDIISSGANNPTAGAIFLIVNEAKLRIAVEVAQPDISGIVIGNRADFRVDSLPKKTFQGKISRVDALMNSATQTQRVLIDFKNPSKFIQAGMYASVSIKLANRNKTSFVIPKNAILTTNNHKNVYVLQGKTVNKVTVKTGVEDLNSVEITQGLKDKDEIILPNGQALEDKMEIMPIYTKTSGEAQTP